jgi:heat shock protein HtpX
MVMVGVMLGAIVLIADVFLRTVGMFGAGPRRSSRDGGGGGAAQAILLVAAVVLAILAPLLAQILYFACSRRREFLADASSARFTRYPEGLASALEKITASASSMSDVSRVLAPMYTVNPREPRGVMGLFSTHPPTDVRIRVLRSMAGRAGLVDYEAAYRQVTGRGCLGKQTLASEGTVAARTPSSEPAPADYPVARARATSDLFRRLANFLVIPCECGVRIKVPPGYEGSTITCARCGRVHALPAALPVVTAGMAGIAAGLPAAMQPAATAGSAGSATPASASPPTLHYQRRGTGGWESFRCQCGQTLQIGPGFHAPHLDCPWCHARIEIT